MTTKYIIGNVITDIFQSFQMEVGGLDTGVCFVQIDNTFVGFTYGPEDEIIESDLPEDSESLFKDLSAIPVYHVNKESKTIGEIADNFKKEQSTLVNKLRRFFFGKKFSFPNEYRPYRVEYKENKLKHIKGQKIIDFVWYADSLEKGLFLLENGCLITETLCAPHGTGLAGLNIFDNIDELAAERGDDYLKISDYI